LALTRAARIGALITALLVAIGLGVGIGVLVSSSGPTAIGPSEQPSRSHGPSGRPTKSPKPSPAAVAIPAKDFKPYTWGYIGCSNTHDTISGYHLASDTAHLFWPFDRYHIEGMSVPHWIEPNSRAWIQYEHMTMRFNGGNDPPVIWVQMCVDLNMREPNYGPIDFNDVVTMLQLVRQHAPNSIVFVSPLQSYDPPTLCAKMGPDGAEIPTMMQWLHRAVAMGLAYPGPGVDGITNLGPLTSKTVIADGCHPSGFPHPPGPGSVFLGKQLAGFFDHLPRA